MTSGPARIPGGDGWPSRRSSPALGYLRTALAEEQVPLAHVERDPDLSCARASGGFPRLLTTARAVEGNGASRCDRPGGARMTVPGYSSIAKFVRTSGTPERSVCSVEQ